MWNMTDNSLNVLRRIHDSNFFVLRDRNGIALNVSYTIDGLRWTTDNRGRALFGLRGNYVEPFKPDITLLRERSFKSKCEKRWVDKANSMLYEQRPIFNTEQLENEIKEFERTQQTFIEERPAAE